MINLGVVVENKNRKFGSALGYYVGYIKEVDGTINAGLFTEKEIAQALERASKNPEDVPVYVEKTCPECPKSVWKKLFSWIFG